ncbi:hypothetical protein [Azospirillum agricola]|uniref:hypothetical protein n=1 Tax=Azospirillum agricola TaxID=1720247 RepID=UPI000A0EF242|nr:hypothetical protein [Azospirillum agricola]SMH54410.1 hypothetical protein SAMN02982994_3595 [Azospirillum lipoferum]
MSSTTSTDANTDSADVTARLTQIGDRTSLMVIDATLRTAHADGVKPLPGLTAAGAADEVRELARRMLQATRDFRAVLHEAAE